MNTKAGSIALAVLLLAGSALGSYAARTQETALSSRTAQMSYSMGLRVGKILASQHIDIDPMVFLRGLKDGRSSQQPRVKEERFHDASARARQAIAL